MDVILVYPALLDDILRTAQANLIKVTGVHIIETVPVQMSVLRKPVLPCIESPSILLIVLPVVVRILHVEIARKIPVVIRTWIRCIIPVHSSVTVLSGTPQKACRSLDCIIRESILQYGHRLECLADAGITHLSVLISPVAVVHIVTHHVIDLLSRCVLCTALTRSGKSHKTYLMTVAELLLYTCIVSEVTVIHTLHPVIATDTGRYIECIRPSVVELSGSICRHKTETVKRTVGESTETPSRTYA